MKLFDANEIRASVQPLANHLPALQRRDMPPPSTLEGFAEEIGRLWQDAQKTFLEIGQHLELAQKTLSPEAFADLCRRLPFGKSARSQLTTAYRLIQSNSLPTGCERAGYATVYLCGTLTDDERRAAVDTGIIRPDMTRADIVSFKKKRAEPKPDPANRRHQLEAERGRLLHRLREIEDELSKHQSAG